MPQAAKLLENQEQVKMSLRRAVREEVALEEKTQRKIAMAQTDESLAKGQRLKAAEGEFEN